MALQARTKTTLTGLLETAITVSYVTDKRASTRQVAEGGRCTHSILFICHGRVVVRESRFDDSQGPVSPDNVDVFPGPSITALMPAAHLQASSLPLSPRRTCGLTIRLLCSSNMEPRMQMYVDETCTPRLSADSKGSVLTVDPGPPTVAAVFHNPANAGRHTTEF